MWTKLSRAIVPGIVCVVLGIGVAEHLGWLTFHTTHDAAEHDSATHPEGESHRTLVELSPAKLAASDIQQQAVQSLPLQAEALVPGRVQYEESRHIEVKAATDVVVTQMLVKPGDKVTAGQVLAVISSPEVGHARADVLQQQAELAQAERKLTWEQKTSQNLDQLLVFINQRKAMRDIETALEKKALGNYREALITAYSRDLLAEATWKSLSQVADSGAIATKTVRERANEREAADAALKAVCEQSDFDAHQKLELAQAQVDDAQRRLKIRQQSLATLLGYEEAPVKPTQTETSHAPQLLSNVEIRAAFTGTIERRPLAANERARMGDTLFVLADTRRMAIVAELREADWSALKIQPGTKLAFDCPALPQRELTAQVEYVGREVLTETHAVPLVATVENAEGLLRPGLFVRVRVPLGDPAVGVTVPSSSIVEHEGVQFVFEPEGARQYRRHNVKTGRVIGDTTEIVSGLSAGQQVVTQGAFVLKSELLLEREE